MKKKTFLYGLVIVIGLPTAHYLYTKYEYKQKVRRYHEQRMAAQAGTKSEKEVEKKQNQNISYNPDTCKTDAQGMVYVAINRTIFRFPYETQMRFGGMSPENRALLPPRPDPSEPEGCPDNPIWTGGFHVDYRQLFPSEDKDNPEYGMLPEKLGIGGGIQYIDHWWLQGSRERSFEITKLMFHDCDEAEEGYIACYVHPKNQKDQRSEWPVSYKAKPEIYSAPLNRPFVVDCSPAMSGLKCQVDYKLESALGVYYDFYRKKLPIKHVIAFDKRLRAYLESVQVKNYWWPDLNEGQGSEIWKKVSDLFSRLREYI